MSKRQRIVARLARVGRTEVVMLERAAGRGETDVVSAIVERQGRGFQALYRRAGMVSGEVDELRAAAAGGQGALTTIPLADARRRLGRAVLAHRIAGRDLPAWAVDGHPLLGDLEQLGEAVDDVYLCAGCERPLDPELQITLARNGGDGPLVLSCPGCRAQAVEVSEASRLVAWAWLRLLAGDPRRALVHAARAEGMRVDPARLDALRGAAMLRLENPVQATAYLRRAVEHDPGDHWGRGRLVEALTRSGYLASASAELARLLSHRPELAPRARGLARAIAHARQAPTAAEAPDLRLPLAVLVTGI